MYEVKIGLQQYFFREFIFLIFTILQILLTLINWVNRAPRQPFSSPLYSPLEHCINPHNHTLHPSLLPSPTPNTHSSVFHRVPILSKSPLSLFHGIKHSLSPLSIPSSSFKSSISAKVEKGLVPPIFTLKDQDEKKISLSMFKGKPVVVYFYPADETPICTKQVIALKAFVYQACAFRDSYEKFKKLGAEVVGISGDDPSPHKVIIILILDFFIWYFAKRYRLQFTLLSDEGNKVRKAWGVEEVKGQTP
ncbi:hypothetical protein CXB51_036637 [Gossypium anomalum]|uniref:Peroxiredoxin Q, chloroplastic n=1 Tax=Gossypium anomalum TaxID=47600 RepID=A0A8J5Y0D4_9ROSI|nr:hypothetical protein CXB51_036637 [Gossypium anomalum]